MASFLPIFKTKEGYGKLNNSENGEGGRVKGV